MNEGSASLPEPGINSLVFFTMLSSSKKGHIILLVILALCRVDAQSYSCLIEGMSSSLPSSEPLLFLASNDLRELAGNKD